MPNRTLSNSPRHILSMLQVDGGDWPSRRPNDRSSKKCRIQCPYVEGKVVDGYVMLEERPSKTLDEPVTIQPMTFITGEPFDDGTRFFTGQRICYWLMRAHMLLRSIGGRGVGAPAVQFTIAVHRGGSWPSLLASDHPSWADHNVASRSFDAASMRVRALIRDLQDRSVLRSHHPWYQRQPPQPAPIISKSSCSRIWQWSITNATAGRTVVRQNDGSIEIAPKDNRKGTRVFHRQAKRYEGELIAAYYRNGFVGVDRLCARLLADAGDGARRG